MDTTFDPQAWRAAHRPRRARAGRAGFALAGLLALLATPAPWAGPARLTIGEVCKMEGYSGLIWAAGGPHRGCVSPATLARIDAWARIKADRR